MNKIICEFFPSLVIRQSGIREGRTLDLMAGKKPKSGNDPEATNKEAGFFYRPITKNFDKTHVVC